MDFSNLSRSTIRSYRSCGANVAAYTKKRDLCRRHGFWNHKTRDLQIAALITENRCENHRREHSDCIKWNCGKILIVKIGEQKLNRIFFLHRILRLFQDLIIANYSESYKLIYMYIENLYWKYLTGLMYIGSRYFRNYTCARLLMLIRIKGIDPRRRSSL